MLKPREMWLFTTTSSVSLLANSIYDKWWQWVVATLLGDNTTRDYSEVCNSTYFCLVQLQVSEPITCDSVIQAAHLAVLLIIITNVMNTNSIIIMWMIEFVWCRFGT